MIIDFRKNRILWCSRYNKMSYYKGGHVFRQNILFRKSMGRKRDHSEWIEQVWAQRITNQSRWLIGIFYNLNTTKDFSSNQQICTNSSYWFSLYAGFLKINYFTTVAFSLSWMLWLVKSVFFMISSKGYGNEWVLNMNIVRKRRTLLTRTLALFWESFERGSRH